MSRNSWKTITLPNYHNIPVFTVIYNEKEEPLKCLLPQTPKISCTGLRLHVKLRHNETRILTAYRGRGYQKAGRKLVSMQIKRPEPGHPSEKHNIRAYSGKIYILVTLYAWSVQWVWAELRWWHCLIIAWRKCNFLPESKSYSSFPTGS